MKPILIAEDNELNRELLVTVLNANGYETLIASNGEEAVKISQTELPELILMDIQMPRLDGFDALALLKQQEQTANIPVIAVTGNAMPHDLEKIEKTGFNSTINKPYKIDELLDTIAVTLDQNH